MNYTILLFAALAFFIIIFVTIQSRINSKKKLRKRLLDSYGKDPSSNFDFEIWGSAYDYWDLKQFNEKIQYFIDDTTWNDLDMDNIFKRLNSCLTSIGDELLFATLREPQKTCAPLEKREILINFFQTHPKERLEIQVILAKLGKANYNGISSLIYDSHLKTLSNPIIFSILTLLPLLSIPVAFFSIIAGILFFFILCIINGIIYYIFKKEISKNLLTLRYLSGMLRCCNRLFKIDAPEALKAYFIDLKKDYTPFKSLESKLSGIMVGGSTDMDIIAEYIRIITLYDLRTYNKTIALVSKNQENFHQLYKDLGELDMALSIASFRDSLPYTVTPDFKEGLDVWGEEIYHPLLKDPVSNTIHFDKNSLITGSNASGKSTFVKALAINALLAQTIYTCTASKFSLGFSLTVTSMAVRDDIMAGDSYFMSEIKSLKRVLELVSHFPCLCFIDEILKGTNTIERIGASASILNYLNQKNCLCLIASHDIELTNILDNAYRNYHFRENITENEISFDYTLYEGPSQTRNAIALLNYLNFDKKIVDTAKELVENFVNTQKWPLFP